MTTLQGHDNIALELNDADIPKNNGGYGGHNGKATPGSPGGKEGRQHRWSELEEVDDSHLDCGYGSCTPGWLQICNNPKIVLVVLCWFSAVQGFVVNGINNVNVSTLERRFDLPSSEVGLISSAYDISAGLLVIPISFFGARANKPRWLGATALIMAAGSFIMFLPHAIVDKYSFGVAQSGTCAAANGTSTACSEGSVLSNYLYVFILGQLLHGVGGTTLYTLGIVYIDENVKTKVSPMYIGIMFGFAALGPAIGYILGGQFLDLYVDFTSTDVSTLSVKPGDPNWVGAWWVGFLVASFFAVTAALMIFCFAYELPTAKVVRAERVSQCHNDGSEDLTTKENFGSVRDFPLSLKILLKNPTFVFITLAGCTEGIVTSGFATFLPKFLQNQFNQTPAWSALLAGFAGVAGAAGGQFVGGFIARKFNLKVRGMVRMAVIICAIATLLCFIFLLYCPSTQVAGVNTHYQNKSISLAEVNMTSSCNADCGCTTLSYEPICGKDGLQFFSPCHAGCTSKYKQGEDQWYGNCSCISASNSTGMIAKDGACEPMCNSLPVFVAIFFFIVFFTFMATPLATSITMRCVPDKERSFAVGLQWLFVRFLGTVLGPVIFGSIFDGTCIVWQEKCGENGSCWIYDNDLLSRNLLLISIAMKAGSTLWFFLAQALYKKPPADKLGTTATTTTPSGQDSQLPKVAVISNGSRDQAGFEGYMECVDRGSGRTNPAFTM